MKEKRIVVPVDDSLHEIAKEKADKRYFDSVAAYVRWLIRNDEVDK